ncbi:MAG: protease complex subunit PrcB family protein [Fimbriimonadaceae bacterium]|nr:MAG: protease complex subunit PrcB family protein [Fimbriimonadaceae bacterium]
MKAGHIISLVLLSGLAGAQVATFGGQATPYKAIRYQAVAQGNNSRIQTAQFDVITGSKDWQTLYSKMAGDRTIGFTPAPVMCDFNSYDLLVIHTGRKNTSGHSVYVSMIRQEKPTEVAVDYVVNQPTMNSMVSQVITSPYVVVVVEKQTAPYRFRGTTAYTTTYIGNGINNNQCSCNCGCAHCGGGGGGVVRVGVGGNPIGGGGNGGEICPPMRNGGGHTD